MFSKTLRKNIKSTGFRLSVWYSGVFIVSSVVVLIAAYFLLASALKAQNRNMILAVLSELELEFTTGGMAAVTSQVR